MRSTPFSDRASRELVRTGAERAAVAAAFEKRKSRLLVP
jgi:DNA repair ATPase RecN